MFLEKIPALSSGSHASPEHGMCVMEAVAFVAGEPFSDHPACACPVISAFLISWNDGLPDAERDELLRPLIPRLVGTRATPEIEKRRGVMAADWLIRTQAPAWLRLAGLTVQADALTALPEITDFAQCSLLMPFLETVRKDAAAAWAAAWDVAWDAARDSTWAAARDAAAAAWYPAWDVAWDAARDAAWYPAWADAAKAARSAAAAAWVKLNPIRLELQQSALALIERMIAV